MDSKDQGQQHLQLYIELKPSALPSPAKPCLKEYMSPSNHFRSPHWQQGNMSQQPHPHCKSTLATEFHASLKAIPVKCETPRVET